MLVFLPGDNGAVDFFGPGFFEDAGAFKNCRTSGGDVINQQDPFVFYFCSIGDDKSILNIGVALAMVFEGHLGQGVTLANQGVS